MNTPQINQIIEHQARLAKAMGNPDRLKILRMLRASNEAGERDMAAAEIGRDLGLAKANLSRHITKMRSVGLVKTRRDGAFLFIREAHPEIGKMCDMMRDLIRADLEERASMLENLVPTDHEPRGALGGESPSAGTKFGVGGA